MPENTPTPTPARSIYGFFLYLLSNTTLVVYIAWAFLPESCLIFFCIYYYPQKYWAVAVPIQCLVALTLFTFFIYPGLNLMLTPAINSVNTITDSYRKREDNNPKSLKRMNAKCICKEKDKCFKDDFDLRPADHEISIPYAYDLDIRDVSRKLYLKASPTKSHLSHL